MRGAEAEPEGYRAAVATLEVDVISAVDLAVGYPLAFNSRAFSAKELILLEA